MKLILFLCLMAFVSPLSPPVGEQVNTESAPTEHTYRTFQPSKIKKQKRKLRPKITALGWGVMLAGLGLAAAVIWLVVFLWPAASVAWRILMFWLGLSLSIPFLMAGLFGWVFGRENTREVHQKAERRLEKLTKKLDFKPEKTWCFPDEHFRLSVAADKNQLLIIDYQQNKGWFIPKENIVAMRSDTVAANKAAAMYPASKDGATLLIQHDFSEYEEPRGRREPPGPMHVLQFSCQNQPLQQMTLIYQPSIFGDSTRTVAADLRALWKKN